MFSAVKVLAVMLSGCRCCQKCCQSAGGWVDEVVATTGEIFIYPWPLSRVESGAVPGSGDHRL